MSPISEDAARSGGTYRRCVQELQKPYPDYAMVQTLATLSLVETLQEVAGQVADLSRQISLAPRR
jgi:hypothetical protein